MKYTIPVNFSLKGQPGKTKKKETSKFDQQNILYIVDGKKFDGAVGDIDPNTIENISVLKNKDALEKYGAKEKDGVIVINTKGAQLSREGELPIVLDGKITGLTLNEVDQNLIQNIKRVEPEQALEKYGEKGKNGVFEITSRNANAGEDEEKITTQLELRRFIARIIKYPYNAMENNIEKTVYLAVKVDNNGKIKGISENESELENYKKTDVLLGAVFVTGKIKNRNKEKTDASAKKETGKETAEKQLVDEAKRVVSKIPVIDIEEFKGKTVGMSVEFHLQD